MKNEQMDAMEEANAASQLTAYLQDGEVVEGIVFGEWGWGHGVNDEGELQPGYGEPFPPPVPFNMRGKLLTLEQAESMMRSWSFYSGYGSPESYAVRIWTNQRVLWITQYDGSTSLSSADRNPREYDMENLPNMPGG